MSDTAIQVENLGKKYIIRHQAHGSYIALRDVIANKLKRVAKNILPPFGRSESYPLKEEFWALKNVSFEVKQGEVIGIIGRNGAGKTTLLKILSRITEPTTGRFRIKGRVASLLEVGTGFHPELTGRENIFLNGAILGMTRQEIKKKFDEIVAFAETEQFLDTPVKRYSSGMYVRLAFAVAAHLEPEILLVDEVLAVGDAQFQKKCLGKIENIAEEGRTVLFVSHNMASLRSLCSRAIRLDNGRITDSGHVDQVVEAYLTHDAKEILEQFWDDPEIAPGNNFVRIKSVQLLYENNETGRGAIYTNTPLQVKFCFWNFQDSVELNLSLHLYTAAGECVFNVASPPKTFNKGLVEGACNIPGNFLNDGYYRLSMMIVQDTSKPLYNLEDALQFHVEDFREGTNWYGKWPGLVRPFFEFPIYSLEDE